MARALPSSAASALLLATDLDGTLLHGTSDDRERLLWWVAENRARVTLVFVTGRTLQDCLPLARDPLLPRPDYVICDVGASVFLGSTDMPAEPLDGALGRAWPGPEAVRREVGPHSPFPEVSYPVRHRLTYATGGAPIPAALKSAIAACGLGSSAYGEFLDILPGGVSKGSTLLRLRGWLGLDGAAALVCGDSMNDLSLFEAGLTGGVVGNASPDLLQKVEEMATVHLSRRPGAGGILDALERWGYL